MKLLPSSCRLSWAYYPTVKRNVILQVQQILFNFYDNCIYFFLFFSYINFNLHFTPLFHVPYVSWWRWWRWWDLYNSYYKFVYVYIYIYLFIYSLHKKSKMSLYSTEVSFYYNDYYRFDICRVLIWWYVFEFFSFF